MGRTLPTSTQLVQEFENKWRPYSRALRKEDRELLDELFAMVRFQSAAIAYTSSAEPFEAFTLAMLGGILKRVMHIEMMLERIGADAPVPSSTDDHPSARDWESDHQLLLPMGDIERHCFCSFGSCTAECRSAVQLRTNTQENDVHPTSDIEPR